MKLIPLANLPIESNYLDIVLGSMTFRLNNKHKALLPETGKRGKRIKPKYAVYKVILSEIRGIYKNFNIGVSTAPMSTFEGRWKTPYGHWNFKSKDGELNRELTKRGVQKIKTPSNLHKLLTHNVRVRSDRVICYTNYTKLFGL